MAALVTLSEQPLVFDTLPAVKATEYYGSLHAGHVYTYARLYALRGALALSLCAFERMPSPASRVGFAFGGGGDEFLFAALSPTALSLHLLPKNEAAALPLVAAAEEQGRQLPAPVPAFFAGADEQGWYWGADLVLDAETAARAGCRMREGEVFSAALFKYGTDEAGFGASCRVDAARPLDFPAFQPFTIVPY